MGRVTELYQPHNPPKVAGLAPSKGEEFSGIVWHQLHCGSPFGKPKGNKNLLSGKRRGGWKSERSLYFVWVRFRRRIKEGVDRDQEVVLKKVGSNKTGEGAILLQEKTALDQHFS